MRFGIQRRVERVNALTHGLGALAALIAFIILMYEANLPIGAKRWSALSLYGVSLCFTLLASCIYHSLVFTKYRKVTHLLDHLSIFTLIAGTNTPLIVLYLPGKMGSIYLTLLWSLAIIGMLLKLRFINSHDRLLTYFYLAMGWLAVIIMPAMWSAIPLPVAHLIIYGGLAYSIGVYFYLNDKSPWLHVIWHALVLLGAGLHFAAIWLAYT